MKGRAIMFEFQSWQKCSVKLSTSDGECGLSFSFTCVPQEEWGKMQAEWRSMIPVVVHRRPLSFRRFHLFLSSRVHNRAILQGLNLVHEDLKIIVY